MRILLADDDPWLGDGLQAGLRQRGFQVDWVRDGLAAERELRSGAYAAAVLDLGLPQLDGMAVLQRVRGAGHHLPVLVLTARDAIDDRIRGLDGGADDYVIKPVDLHELRALMLQAGRVLSREQLEQQLYSWGREVESNAVEVHIHHLRRKLRPDLITTVRGVGYAIARG